MGCHSGGHPDHVQDRGTSTCYTTFRTMNKKTLISRAMSILGKRSAAKRKQLGHDRAYYRRLAQRPRRKRTSPPEATV